MAAKQCGKMVGGSCSIHKDCTQDEGHDRSCRFLGGRSPCTVTTSCRERSNHYRIPYCKGCGEDRPSVEPATGAVTTAGAGADAGVDPEAGADADADAGFGDGAGAGAGAGSVAGAVVPDGAETAAATEAPAALTPAAETPSAAESPPAETVADAGEAAGTATPSAGNAFLTRILRVSNSAISTGATGWQALLEVSALPARMWELPDGLLVCEAHLSQKDQGQTAEMIRKSCGIVSIGGMRLVKSWFVVYWDERTSIAYLKFTKLNRDTKVEDGVTSVVTLQMYKATGFNIAEHARFHGLNPGCSITNASICGYYAISPAMLISVSASVVAEFRSPRAKYIFSMGADGLAACGLEPASTSRCSPCCAAGCMGSSAKLSGDCTVCHASFHASCIPATAVTVSNSLYCGLPCAPPVKRRTAVKTSDTASAAGARALAAANKRAEKLEADLASAKAVTTASAAVTPRIQPPISMAPPPSAASSGTMHGDFSDRGVSILKLMQAGLIESQKSAQVHGENMMAMYTLGKRAHTQVAISEADQRVADRQAAAEIQTRKQARREAQVARQAEWDAEVKARQAVMDAEALEDEDE